MADKSLNDDSDLGDFSDSSSLIDDDPAILVVKKDTCKLNQSLPIKIKPNLMKRQISSPFESIDSPINCLEIGELIKKKATALSKKDNAMDIIFEIPSNDSLTAEPLEQQQNKRSKTKKNNSFRSYKTEFQRDRQSSLQEKSTKNIYKSNNYWIGIKENEDNTLNSGDDDDVFAQDADLSCNQEMVQPVAKKGIESIETIHFGDISIEEMEKILNEKLSLLKDKNVDPVKISEISASIMNLVGRWPYIHDDIKLRMHYLVKTLENDLVHEASQIEKGICLDFIDGSIDWLPGIQKLIEQLIDDKKK